MNRKSISNLSLQKLNSEKMEILSRQPTTSLLEAKEQVKQLKLQSKTLDLQKKSKETIS